MADPARLTPQAEREMEAIFDMQRRAWQLLDLICMEFKTDPMSVQCFDARIVREAIELVARRRRCKDPFNPLTDAGEK